MMFDRFAIADKMTRGIVGQRFKGHDGKIYRCDGYDPRQGYWMQSVDDPAVRRNVSERAIGSVFHRCPDSV